MTLPSFIGMYDENAAHSMRGGAHDHRPGFPPAGRLLRRSGVQAGPPFEEYTPICIKEGKPHERRIKTKFERRRGSGEGNSSAYNHSYMYDSKENWKGGTSPGGR
jgi:hypothetical protein